MKRRLLLAAVIPVLAACTVSVIGPKQVLIPDGETITVTLASSATREGELLAVTGTELILNEQGRLVAVGLPALSKVLVVRYEDTVDGEWTEKLSLYCRYPQGLAEEQWHQLLMEAGQGDFQKIESKPAAVIVKPSGPWAGKWNVQGASFASGLWVLKQEGETVTSTGESYYRVSGKAAGDKFEGDVMRFDGNRRDVKFNFVLSSDGKSFDGYVEERTGTKRISGIKVE